ncbi:hypothetical protein [Massilia sp. erpn]|uniref:hypothetical protein n=1 Tax=Massilia sp. erpn TaxID=2738142 RepID=UPI002102CB4F|nr:hypothetical protein [Massilia sp. erpn]
MKRTTAKSPACLEKGMLLFDFLEIIEGSEVNRIQELTEALKAKNAGRPCTRCGNTRFEVVGEQAIEVSRPGSGLLSSLMDHQQTVQAVLVACSHCGNISTHSIGILSKPSTVQWL